MLIRQLAVDLIGVPDEMFDDVSVLLTGMSSAFASVGLLTQKTCQFDFEKEDRVFCVIMFARGLRLVVDAYYRTRYVAVDIVEDTLKSTRAAELLTAVVEHLRARDVHTQEIIRVSGDAHLM